MALIRKRRLTEQQQRRIQKQHKTRQEEADTSQDLEGLVVQHYGRQLEVQALSVPELHPEKPDRMSNSDTRIRKSALQQEVARSDMSQIFITNPKGLDRMSRPFTLWVVYKLKYFSLSCCKFQHHCTLWRTSIGEG